MSATLTPVKKNLPLTGAQRLWLEKGKEGCVVTLHEFTSSTPVDWSGEFAAERVGLCLNWSGHGVIEMGKETAEYGSKTLGLYSTSTGRSGNGMKAMRDGAEAHSFITFEWSRAAFRRQVMEWEGALPSEVRAFLEPKAKKGGAFLSKTRAMPSGIDSQALYLSLRQPPILPAATSLWYRGKALELLALFLFEKQESTEMFCSRHNRVARERVEKTVQILQAHLAEPPDLEALGAQVGCSPFYLSRLFSKEMKFTIPQYVRELRMNRAAELLRAGRHNVTEAAMEVGYNSLSHFSKAFWEKFGCCPGLYPQGEKLFSRHRQVKS